MNIEKLEELRKLFEAGYSGTWEERPSATDDPTFRSISANGHYAFMEVVTQMESDEQESPWLRANLDWVIETHNNFLELVDAAEKFYALRESLVAVEKHFPDRDRHLINLGRLL